MSFFESLRISFFSFLAWEFWGWQHKILIMSIKRQWSKWSTWFNINKFIIDEFIKWLRNKCNSFRISKENGISNLFPCPRNTIPGNYIYSYLRDKSLSLYPPSYVSDALEISLYTQEAYNMDLILPLGVFYFPWCCGAACVQRGPQPLRQRKHYF